MAERKPAKKDTQQPAKRTTGKASNAFTDEERAAMRERAQELKAATRHGPHTARADGESDVLAKIAEVSQTEPPPATVWRRAAALNRDRILHRQGPWAGVDGSGAGRARR